MPDRGETIEAPFFGMGHIDKIAGALQRGRPLMGDTSGEHAIHIVKGANADFSPADVERAGDVPGAATSSCCSSRCRS